MTIRSGSDTYDIVFDGGHVVAASAPGTSITVLGIAFAQELVSVAQVAQFERLPESERDLALAAWFEPDQLLRLRRQAIAAAATRTFALLEGDFTFAPEITLPVAPNTAMHVGGLIYHGVVTNLDDTRLGAAIAELGTAFSTRADGIADLQYFGFGEPELIVVRGLADGITLPQLEALPATERRIAFATVYTLASLGALYCETPSTAPRVARGTGDPMPAGPAIARTRSGGIHPRSSSPAMPRVPTPPSFTPSGSRPSQPPLRGSEPAIEDAATLLRKGQAALRDDRLEDAVLALTKAVELAPEDLDAKAALAWARFCTAANKPAAADAVRQVLVQIANKSDRPVLPYYYLGMIERIVGRNAAALAHFHQVLELDPSHREASTELRFLSRNSGPIKR